MVDLRFFISIHLSMGDAYTSVSRTTLEHPTVAKPPSIDHHHPKTLDPNQE